MESVAVRDPVAVGLNLTDTVQFEKGARVAVQVVLFRKSAGSTPPSVIVLMFSVTLWLLVTVTVIAAVVLPTDTLPNMRAEGETVTWVTPVPATDALCGELLALSVTFTIADLAPCATGLNCT
jgi:hypothetical protein